MKTILFIVSVIFSAQASATTLAMTTTGYTPQEDTKVIKVEFTTVQGVSCPGSLSLFNRRLTNKIYTVGLTTTTINNAVLDVTEKLSQNCQDEILENKLQKQPVFTCLSFGFPSGSVYLPVSDGEEVVIEFPLTIKVQEITELK